MGPAGHGKEKSKQTHLLVKSVSLVNGVTRLVIERKISIINKILAEKVCRDVGRLEGWRITISFVFVKLSFSA